MARRWADPAAFRPSPDAALASRPSWRQSLALVTALIVVAGVISAVSYVVRPDRARSFDLLHGSVLIADQFGPVSVDVGSGKGTLQIRGADAQAGVTTPGGLALVPFDSGTLLLNRRTGEFNMVDTTGFLQKRDGGVSIGGSAGADTAATGIAAGQLAYIERSGSTGTDVLLVGPSTVQVAAANPKSVKPRASYATASAGVIAEGGAASANGDLWALFRTADAQRDQLRRLTLPANSSTGARLVESNQGTVDALSAIESATANDDGTGGDVIGVASPGRVRIVEPGLKTRTVTYTAPAGLDTVVPTTGARGRLSWLLHGTEGWSLLSVRTDGTDRQGPEAFSTIEPDAQLAPAAQSLGSLYTMLRSGNAGSIYRIDFDGKVTAVADSYPQKTSGGRSLESASFADGYLVARESRVVVDSPSHYLALTVFTDGSRKPYVIQKSNLTSVNAAAGADSLTKGPAETKPGTSAGGPTKGRQVPAPSINNKINCRQVNQKPHMPVISSVDPSARSVGLAWSYTALSSQDCLPSTYVVTVRLLSADAPPAPGSVTLQKQLDTIIAGLYPSTQYQFTVTAYINGQSTSSQPVQVTTGKEGPAAPKDLSVTADSSGNWNLAWSGCGTVANKCVPAGSWSIQPTFCDGRGLSGSPAAITAPADPTSVRQPGATYRGGGSLLGRSLAFTIQGTGEDGTRGDVSARSACVQSWAPPNTSAITLRASKPPQTGSASQDSYTIATLSFAGSQQVALGGIGAQITYRLVDDRGSVVRSTGPTSATTARLDGVQPGRGYRVLADIVPPGHPNASASVGPVDITQATAFWPQIALAVSDVRNQGALSATFTLQAGGLSSAQSNGERFDITYETRCDNGAFDTTRNGIDPAAPITIQVDRLRFYGNCTVAMTSLVESQHEQIYSGPQHLGTSGGFQIDAATLTGVGNSDFSAAWTGNNGASYIQPRYNGGNPVLGLTSSWSVQVSAPQGGAGCSPSYSGNGSLSPLYIPQSCVDSYKGSGAGWTVTISATSLGQQQGPFTVSDVTGTAPSYVPPQCSVTSLTATWDSDSNPAQPTITVDGTQSQFADCTGWSYAIIAPGGDQCGSGSNAAPPQTIGKSCDVDPATAGWQVRVGYTDLGGTATSTTLDVRGTPPS